MPTLQNDFRITETLKSDLIQGINVDLIKKYKACPKSVGRTQALRQLNGESLTPKQATLAACFSCTGGVKDCMAFTCPLYKRSSYKDKEFKAYDSERMHKIIKDYEANTVCSAGKTYYLRYLKGEKITYMESILAKCAECQAGYADGRADCGISSCCLYSFMPYRKERL